MATQEAQTEKNDNLKDYDYRNLRCEQNKQGRNLYKSISTNQQGSTHHQKSPSQYSLLAPSLMPKTSTNYTTKIEYDQDMEDRRRSLQTSKSNIRELRFSLSNFGDNRTFQQVSSVAQLRSSNNNIFERLYPKNSNIQIKSMNSMKSLNFNNSSKNLDNKQLKSLYKSPMSAFSNTKQGFSQCLDNYAKQNTQKLAKTQSNFYQSQSQMPMMSGHKLILEQQRSKENQDQQQRVENQSQKMRARDDILEKQRLQKLEQLQIQKDKIDRRLLRSKIHKTLSEHARGLCKDQLRRQERLSYVKIKAFQEIEQMEEKYNHYKDLAEAKKQQEIAEDEEGDLYAKHAHQGRTEAKKHRMRFPNPEADYYKFMIPEFPLKGCSSSDPNEVLVTKLNEQELQLIHEDPNYFIRSKKMRDIVNLFESQADEFSEDKNAKIRGKLIKEQFFKQHKQDKVLGQIQDFEKKYGGVPQWAEDMKERIEESKYGTGSQRRDRGSNHDDSHDNFESVRAQTNQKSHRSVQKLLVRQNNASVGNLLHSTDKKLNHFDNGLEAANKKKLEILLSLQRTDELKRQSVIEKYQKKLRQAENQKEEERRKRLTSLKEKRLKVLNSQKRIQDNQDVILEEKEIEKKYLMRVKDQMEKISTKENKLREEVQKLLPVKIHLKAWEEKLQLKDHIDDSYEKRILKTKEEKFDKLIEQLYSMEWNKLREENAMEFQYMKNNVFKKIQKAQDVLNNL